MATTITRQPVVINDETTVEGLLDNWTNGNLSDVYNALDKDHPGLTALFLTEGIRRKRLNTSDVNRIVNKLIDNRKELLHENDYKGS